MHQTTTKTQGTKKTRPWLWVLVVLGLAVVGFGGYTLAGPALAARAQTQPAGQETAIVSRDELRVTVSANGSLTPARSAALSFASAGRVAEVLAQEGDAVQAGQALARLDNSELIFQAAQAEAGLVSAQAQLDALLAPPSAEDVAAAEAALRSATAQYDKVAKGKQAEEIAIAQTNVLKAQAAVQQAQAAYDKVSWRADIAATQQSLDLQRATQDYENAVANFKLVTKGASVEDLAIASAGVASARTQLARVRATPSAESIAMRQAAVRQAQASLDAARWRVEQTVLVAPFDGVIAGLNVEVGQAVAGPALTLVDMAHLQVELLLNENDVAKIAVGQPAAIRLDAFPKAELIGVVTAIAPTSQTQSGVVLYPVSVALSDAPAGLTLRAGMTAEVDITVEARSAALNVPLAAVEVEGGQSFVWKQTGSAEQPFERTPVMVGVTVDGVVEIVSGLEEGAVIRVTTQAASSPKAGAQPVAPFGGMLGGARPAGLSGLSN